MFDLHAHTFFSDAQIDIDTILKGMIDLGIKIVGFCDHVFPGAMYKHPIQLGRVPPGGLTNCYSADTLRYRKRALQYYERKYPEIRILNGAEIDALPHGGLTLPPGIRVDFFDYILFSKHHTFPKQFNFLYKKFPNLEKWMWTHSPRLQLNQKLWERGLYGTFKMYRPDIFAHPQEGLPKYLPKDVIQRVVMNCKKYGVAIEINGQCLYEKKHHLPTSFYKFGAEYGTKFSISSDFHGFKKAQANELNFSQSMAYKIVEEYGLQLVDPTQYLPENREKRMEQRSKLFLK
jgi:histidinol phosphatase-like PHP family hydrolase